MKLGRKRLPTKVILRTAIPKNTRGSFRTLSNSSKKLHHRYLKGSYAFELVDVSYYQGVPLSLTRNLSSANVLENVQLSW